MKQLHLVCNAHIDPVWIWEWQEGIAFTLATFRSACNFCDEGNGFIFNHNEAILYRYVEEHDPALFARIQNLVKQGKWHIMGGWYIQSDCNQPSGESFVRQIQEGNRYFEEKFGVCPTTAINFDPFGHTQGLVQILYKAGYDSYVFCRPLQKDCPLVSDDFIWEGLDGSRIVGFRASAFYSTEMGFATRKIKQWLAENAEKDVGMILWGMGNQWGGPTRVDLQEIAELNATLQDFTMVHSIPENYFREMAEKTDLPVHRAGLNAWATGCYTSQMLVKQRHRLLENELYAAEKMLTHAWLAGLMPIYPQESLLEAQRDMLVAEFHDGMTGTCMQVIHDAWLQKLGHGLEIVSQLKQRAYFALTAGQKKPVSDETPILIYNPHPYPVTLPLVFEFCLAEPNFRDHESTLHMSLTHDGDIVPFQQEKEQSNVGIEFRKRIVFEASLPPSGMARYDCATIRGPKMLPPIPPTMEDLHVIRTPDMEVAINACTGLMDRYRIHGVDMLKPGAFCPMVMEDIADPWGCEVKEYRAMEGLFQTMDEASTGLFCGVKGNLSPVRIIEDGPIRTVVEAVMGYRTSRLVQTYIIPKKGTEIEIQLKVYMAEKDHMLKWSIPTTLEGTSYWGQTAFGVHAMDINGQEACAQKWTALSDGKHAVSCINDGTYGSDAMDGEMRISLLRTSSYSSLFMPDRDPVPTDRHRSRIDQDERIFHFWINAGDASDRLNRVEREAQVHAEPPYAVSMFPDGSGTPPKPLAILSDDILVLSAAKKMEDSNHVLVRVFNPTSGTRSTKLTMPAAGAAIELELGRYEVKTLEVDTVNHSITERELIEHRIPHPVHTLPVRVKK